jgi:DNA-binding MarR family transcriptional regulator
MKVTTADYRALAAWRYHVRLFLQEGDAAARRVGLEPQQYLLMLAVRGLPEGTEATVQTLAERLMLKHNSTVELIDRLEARGYVRRSRSHNQDDRRRVRVELCPRGKKLVERVARRRLTELRTEGAELVNALNALTGRKLESSDKSRSNKSRAEKQQANNNARPDRMPHPTNRRGKKS